MNANGSKSFGEGALVKARLHIRAHTHTHIMSSNLNKHEASWALTRLCLWFLRPPLAIHTHSHTCCSIHETLLLVVPHTRMHTHTHTQNPVLPLLFHQHVMLTATQEKPCVHGVVTTVAVAVW